MKRRPTARLDSPSPRSIRVMPLSGTARVEKAWSPKSDSFAISPDKFVDGRSKIVQTRFLPPYLRRVRRTAEGFSCVHFGNGNLTFERRSKHLTSDRRLRRLIAEQLSGSKLNE